jgi:hypothetical protein
MGGTEITTRFPGQMIHENNLKSKSHDTVPLTTPLQSIIMLPVICFLEGLRAGAVQPHLENLPLIRVRKEEQILKKTREI